MFVQSSLSCQLRQITMEPNSGFNLVWLGLNWDLVTGTISVTDRRISKFAALNDKFLPSAPHVTTRDCAVFMMFMSAVLGNLILLKTRGAFVVGRTWTACEAVKSSTWRERKTIHFALSAFKALIRVSALSGILTAKRPFVLWR